MVWMFLQSSFFAVNSTIQAVRMSMFYYALHARDCEDDISNICFSHVCKSPSPPSEYRNGLIQLSSSSSTSRAGQKAKERT